MTTKKELKDKAKQMSKKELIKQYVKLATENEHNREAIKSMNRHLHACREDRDRCEQELNTHITKSKREAGDSTVDVGGVTTVELF